MSSQHATAAGEAVHYVVSGRADGPTMILVHGGGANVGWWRFLAPLLEPGWRVVALDLSGHGGDSGWRPAYSVELWSEEVRAVTEAGGGAPAVLVGHSMGGGIALATAARHPELVAGVALLDSAVWRPGLDRFEAQFRQSVYPSREAAEAAFKLMPPQPPNRRAEAELAPISVTEREGGWSWKWDPRALPSFSGAAVRDLLPRVRCPLVEIAGARSEHVDAESLRILREATGREVPLVEVEGAFHHVMLDRPGKVAAALVPWAEAALA